ncbi:protein of unknown function [Nitrospira defluvii]|uniref:Uncharacterized protein n=1 Tax=Nitrospira defluvii TaxID=330214 RepID=D8PGJ8_9BACT|nr:protein of unknown function [Nitrospira defluvii]
MHSGGRTGEVLAKVQRGWMQYSALSLPARLPSVQNMMHLENAGSRSNPGKHRC